MHVHIRMYRFDGHGFLAAIIVNRFIYYFILVNRFSNCFQTSLSDCIMQKL